MQISLDDIGKQSLPRAEALLAGIPGGIDKALKSALSRSAQHLRTNASKQVRKRYDISNQNLRAEKSITSRYSYSAGSGMSATIRFAGTKIPLYRFGGASPTTPTYRGDLLPVLLNGHWKMVHPGVTAAGHQLKGTSPKTLEGTFVARFSSGHIGIFERTGGSSASGGDAIREIMGSSLPQMVGNEAVLESLSESVRDKFDERLTHEVDAILNGWR